MHTKFAKYEGAGNDFILVDNRDKQFVPVTELIARLCDRHFGIGADGVMTLQTTAKGEIAMRYFNADGSEGEMCGNGARCFALFMEHLGIGDKIKHFKAADGAHTAVLSENRGAEGTVELGMIPVSEIRSGEGWWFLNTGVPHYVEFVEELASVDVFTRGRAIRRDTARFAQGTNVNFVQVTGDGKLSVRTYERGVEQETLACGTGATAAAIVANFALQQNTTEFGITVPGGSLHIGFTHPAATQNYTDIRLTGPARHVFSGEIDLENE